MSDATGQPPVNYNAPNGSYPPAQGGDFPGKTLGIVGLVCAIVFNVIGGIISIVAYSQSKKAGFKNTPAVIGIWVGFALFVVWVIVWIVSLIALASVSTQLNNLDNLLIAF